MVCEEFAGPERSMSIFQRYMDETLQRPVNWCGLLKVGGTQPEKTESWREAPIEVVRILEREGPEW